MAAKKKTTTEKELPGLPSVSRRKTTRALRMTPEELKERVKVLANTKYCRTSGSFIKSMGTALGKARLLTLIKQDLDLNETATIMEVSGPLTEGYARVDVSYGLCDMKVVVKRELYFSVG